MILVTVGVQLPFDRLVRTVDDWAASRARRDVVAQIGATAYSPRAMAAHPFLKAAQMAPLLEEAELMVAHAGMGSIITALEMGKPIFILPRRAALGEHRNDHQLATARRMAAQANVSVAEDEQALVRLLDGFRASGSAPAVAAHASNALLAELTAFIQARPARSRVRVGA